MNPTNREATVSTPTDLTAARRTALVTGTSSGIGLFTAVGLARAGLDVVATMRNPAASNELQAAADAAGVALRVLPLDVTDAEGAADCVRQVLADHGRIDVLINNAGQGCSATLEQLTLDDLRAQIEVNYIGVAALTQLVLPSMRAAASGRIVSVTSIGGTVGQPFSDAYCAAKFAVEGLMQSLAPVAATFGIDVCVVEPGPVSTNFTTNAAYSTRTADDAYAAARAAFERNTSGSRTLGQTPADAAAVVIEAATTSTPKFRWQTSDFVSRFIGLSLADLDGARVLRQTSRWLV